MRRIIKRLGPGLITGAADDDPCAIGTYSMAGAAFGSAVLWMAPVTLPMMSAVVYLAAKIGMVSGQGLAGAIRQHYGRWVLYPLVLCLLAANLIEAGADLGAIAAGINLLVPAPFALVVVLVTLIILALQIWGSYRLIERIFRWLALSLFSYVAAGFMARPALGAVLKGTFVPSLQFDAEFLAILVAVIGTTLSPYLYFWQASQQVEEEKALGRKRLWQRRGASSDELSYAAWDINVGMVFSNVIMYFIILATAATLHRAGVTKIESAAQAAGALRPVAGGESAILFALGMVGVGFLAVPVMTAGAAYALAETFGWRQGLDERPRRAKSFYIAIAGGTLMAMAFNFLNINPIGALFWASVIQGFLAPPLMLVMMLLTNSRGVMGDKVNGWGLNVLGGITTVAVFAATAGLIVTWVTG